MVVKDTGKTLNWFFGMGGRKINPTYQVFQPLPHWKIILRMQMGMQMEHMASWPMWWTKTQFTASIKVRVLIVPTRGARERQMDGADLLMHME